MNNKKLENTEHEELTLLFKGSLRSIPFNVILALILVFLFTYHAMPFLSAALWFGGIIILSLMRFVYCKTQLNRAPIKLTKKDNLPPFLILTCLTGLIWGACYFIFLPHLTSLPELVLMLTLGGMSAGAIASLSIYLPAYYAYILPIFVPIIIYNLTFFSLDRFILVLMFSLFILMLVITAKLNSELLQKTLQLTEEKDFLIESLTSTNNKLEQSMKKVQLLSITDPLTELYNRRHFTETFKTEINRAKRNHHTLDLILIDVDNFKHINDTYGHPSGDIFLVSIANVLNKVTKRSNDNLFRLGGDEFAILLTNSSLENSIQLCNTIQREFETINMDKQVSLSIGLISIAHDQTQSLKELVSDADKVLYLAKKQGKNQIQWKIIDQK